MPKNLLSRFFFLFLMLTIQHLMAQEGYKVEILNAKSLKAGKTADHQKLVGSVILQQGEAKLFCDSAEINQLNNDFDAWGNVFINKGDSIKAWGDSLHYFGTTERGKLMSRARLRKGNTFLTTDVLYMDQKRDIFYYLSSAIITMDQTVITSKKGYYFNATSKITFKDSVVVKDPEYTIIADTLDYYSSTEKVVFQGPTNIITEQDSIYCERGFYNPDTKIAEFRQNARVASEENILYGDSIWVEELNGISRAYQNVILLDTANKIKITGHFAFFDQNNNSSIVTDSAIFIQELDDDTLYMHGDTIRAIEDSTEIKSFYVHYGVRMYKNDMQAVCDSMTYSFKDSLIRLFRDPIVWNGKSQLTGDSIKILTYDNKVHRLFIDGKSFIISESDSVYLLYDQIKGRKMIGYFLEGKLTTMDVNGNGQTIYYAKEEDGSYSGVNKADCSNIRIRFANNEIDEIVFLTLPEASFFPLNQFPEKDAKLDGFLWEIGRRPQSREDLFRTSN